MLTKTRHCCFN